MTLVLQRSEIEGMVSVADGVAAVEAIHLDLGLGVMEQPAPVALASAADDTVLLPMAARSDRLGMGLVKLMADIPATATSGSVQRSTIVAVSTATGECLGVLEGGPVTRQRTAAASAVATRHLARPESRVLGIIGAGNLAVEHVLALGSVLDLEQIVVWSRTAETVRTFVARVREAGVTLPIVPASGPQDVARTADVICTLTPSSEPVLRGAWLRPGQHVNAVGAPPRTTHREVDADVLRRSRLVVDSAATAWAKSGDLVLAVAEGAVPADGELLELGTVVAGLAPGRTAPDEITLFNSVGLAAQDLALTAAVLDGARRHVLVGRSA